MKEEQWEHPLSSAMTRKMWGDLELASAKVMKCRFELLGHIARMPEQRVLKIACFLLGRSLLPTRSPKAEGCVVDRYEGTEDF